MIGIVSASTRGMPVVGRCPLGRTAGVLLACAVLVMLAWGTASAKADGDPASDYLLTQSVFITGSAPASQRAQLQELTAAARAHGFPVKVAVIGSAYDLGSITPLWGKPQRYAQFLGAELASVYNGPLLVVMPSGYGVYGGRRPAADRRALKGLAVQPGPAGLVRSVVEATRRLASANGHSLPAITAAAPSAAGNGGEHPAPPGRGTDWLGVIVIVLGLGLVAAAWVVSVRRRPLRIGWVGRLRARVDSRATAGSRWLLIGAVPVAVAVGVAAALVHPLGDRGTASAQQSSRPGPGLTWRAGTHPAPRFDLTDQRGAPVSLRSLRGSVAILAFVDPVCRSLCPLEAALLGDVERRFPASRRPPIVAVSVNPWGDARTQLVQDVRKWRVGGGWRWAVGSRAELARVWHSYGVGVRVRALKVAGKTVHEISHSEQIYLIDRNGFEREVIPYPFTVAAVVRSVTRLETGDA